MGKRWRKEGIVKNEIVQANGEEVSPRSKIPNLLNKIEYRYVPAVKSKEYYRTLLIQLYNAVSMSVDSPLKIAADKFSNTLREYTSSLSDIILNCINLESELSLPQNFSEIFERLMFQTRKKDSAIMVPLSQRGDGIQARHIPIILKYIADENYKQSTARGATKVHTIWGFEEPENGLELLKAFEMANQFVEYSEELQIFVTTHSPAFYAEKINDGVKAIYIKRNMENDATVAVMNPEKRYMDENMGLMPLVTPYINKLNKRILEMKYMWESEPLIDQATIMVEGKSDKSYLEMAIKELSDPLTAMIRENKLRIVTKEEGAGTTLIKKWVIAWLHSGNNAKLLAVFDKDCAGNSAVEALKKNELYSSQKLNKVKAMQLEPSDEIIELYKRKIHVPFEVEHLLSVEMWEKAIKKKYVTPRSSLELLESYKGTWPREKSIDSIIDEKVLDNGIRETIANFNPHEDKKIDFCNMVEQFYQSKELENIFVGFQRTITKIEQFFL